MAQALFHAWEFLLLELSTCLPANETVVRQMLQVAQQCLNANQSATGPESIFVKLVAARADLALVLVQRLVKSSIAVKDINQLLVTLVATIRGVEEPLAKESAAYYRTLLKCLFVTLRAYQLTDQKAASDSSAELESSAADVTQTILNILDHVVCKGFRALVSLIHDNDAEVVPEDLALLTAILQASLGLPTIEQSQTQVMNIVASHDAVHAATALFSWADKLAHQGDPVYGELSILFLLELSTLPLIAERLVTASSAACCLRTLPSTCSRPKSLPTPTPQWRSAAMRSGQRVCCRSCSICSPPWALPSHQRSLMF